MAKLSLNTSRSSMPPLSRREGVSSSGPHQHQAKTAQPAQGRQGPGGEVTHLPPLGILPVLEHAPDTTQRLCVVGRVAELSQLLSEPAKVSHHHRLALIVLDLASGLPWCG